MNISFKRNLHTVITGDNGSGKSTLLGLMTGILTPDKGSVEVFSNKFAYVGATPLIIKGSLKENLMYGNSIDISDEEIIELVKSYNLLTEEEPNLLEKQISNKSLSSGQMQKISFIRAMLSKPEILILDESTSNLDFDSRKLINQELKKSKITIINSTHSIGEIEYDLRLHIDIKESTRTLRII